jgi:radical SAM superfamily enzyme YgiQ (UPF0313 family)
MYLASVLREAGNHQPKIIDARLWDISPDEIVARAEEFDPDVIAITSMTIEFEATRETAAAIKQRWAERPVLLGGPYASSDPDMAIEDPNVDFLFIGEAEKNFVTWVKSQESGGDVSEIPSIRYRINGEVKTNPSGGYIDNLDELPLPAWDLIDMEKHFEKKWMVSRTMNPHQKNTRVVPLITSRGCPFRCFYCHNLFGNKVRKRSIESVIDEMVMLKTKYDIQEIEYIDDIFNIDVPRAKEIFRQIIDKKLNLNFSFPNGLRSDMFDEELMDLMKEGGVYRMVFAIESGTPRIQKLMHKNLNLQKAQANITMADKKGFFCGGFFMMGFPSETEDEVWNTINFARDSKLQTATFLILQPFPGTEFWDQAVEAGMDLKKGYMTFYQVTINLSKVASEQLDKLRRKAIALFYFNPVRLYKFMTRAPNFFKKSFEYAAVLLLALVGKWRH